MVFRERRKELVRLIAAQPVMNGTGQLEIGKIRGERPFKESLRMLDHELAGVGSLFRSHLDRNVSDESTVGFLRFIERGVVPVARHPAVTVDLAHSDNVEQRR